MDENMHSTYTSARLYNKTKHIFGYKLIHQAVGPKVLRLEILQWCLGRKITLPNYWYFGYVGGIHDILILGRVVFYIMKILFVDWHVSLVHSDPWTLEQFIKHMQPVK